MQPPTPLPAARGNGASDAVPSPDTGVGRVQGLQDSTPLLWHVAVHDGAYLQLDDVVVTARDVPGRGVVITSGIVTEVRARHEGVSFGSDVFLVADGVMPGAVQEVAEVTTTRVEPEFYVPPRPGEHVRRATGEERDQALYFDRMERKVPVGSGRDGETVYVNMDFVDGTRGGCLHQRHFRGRDENLIRLIPFARDVPR